MNIEHRLSDAVALLSQAQPALRALSGLIGHLPDARHPTSAPHGVRVLLDQQIDALSQAAADLDDALDDLDTCEGVGLSSDDLQEALRRFAHAQANRPAWHDLDTIAARARVRKAEVARVMFVLTGEDHEGDAYRPWDGNMSEGLPAHIVSGLCWDVLSQGELWGRVSEATGVDLMTLKEVLEAMIAHTPLRPRTDPRPFGYVLDAQAEDRQLAQRLAEKGEASEDEETEALDRLSGTDLGALADQVGLDEARLRDAIQALLDEAETAPSH